MLAARVRCVMCGLVVAIRVPTGSGASRSRSSMPGDAEPAVGRIGATCCMTQELRRCLRAR